MPIGEMIETLLAVLFLMGAYLFAGKLDMSKSKYKSHWLSFAGGVSMGYVFMHLLPELSLFQAGYSGPIRSPNPITHSGTFRSPNLVLTDH